MRRKKRPHETKTQRRHRRQEAKEARANRALFDEARRECTAVLGLMLAEERWPEIFLLEKEPWRSGQRVAERDHGALATGKVSLRRSFRGEPKYDRDVNDRRYCGYAGRCRHGRNAKQNNGDKFETRRRRAYRKWREEVAPLDYG